MGVPAHPVVVGVDGSDRSIPALRWAGSEAAARRLPLVAVLACGGLPTAAPYAPHAPALTGLAGLAGSRPAERLAHLVEAAFGGAPPVPVDEICDPRAPVPALLAHGAGAALLVLATSPEPVRPSAGGRQRPGSTALALIRYAPCPVVLLPVTRTPIALTPA